MLESLPSVYEALSLILSSNERRERIEEREDKEERERML